MSNAAGGWGIEISPAQMDLFRRYMDFVLEWGKNTNLTADLKPQAIASRHLADGLVAARFLNRFARGPAPRIVDVGAGAGFVGITLKIVKPETLVTLIEPGQKRYDFLNLAVLKLGLRGLKVMRKKMPQDCGSLAGAFDVALERALAPLPQAMSLCWPLVAPGAYLAAYQSQPIEARTPALKRWLDLNSARLVESLPYRLPFEERDRFLSFFQKMPWEMN